MILHAVIIVFSLFAISRSVLRYRDGLITMTGCLFWSGLWILVTIAVYAKDWTSSLSVMFGIGRGVDMLFLGAILLLSYLSFRLYVYLEITRRQLTQLVRAIAINEKRDLLCPIGDEAPAAGDESA
jgi:hypothetical protein